jgi:hypothetical protein
MVAGNATVIDVLNHVNVDTFKSLLKSKRK